MKQSSVTFLYPLGLYPAISDCSLLVIILNVMETSLCKPEHWTGRSIGTICHEGSCDPCRFQVRSLGNGRMERDSVRILVDIWKNTGQCPIP